MIAELTQIKISKFHLFIIAGLMLVILSGWIPVFLDIRTFMFTWKVELAASIFITAVSICLFRSKTSQNIRRNLSQFDIHFVVLPLTLFILWSALSSIWAVSKQSAIMHTAIWAVYLIFYLSIRNVLETGNNFKLLLTLLTILLIVVGVPIIAEYSFLLYFKSLTTLGIRSAKYNELIIIVCPLLAAAVMRWSGAKFRLGVLFVSILWLFTISTMSRTGLGLFIMSIVVLTSVVFLFKQFKTYRRKAIFLSIVLILAPIPVHLISLLAPKPEIPLLSRIKDSDGSVGEATNAEVSNNSRKMLATISTEIIKSHPLTGVGASNFGIEVNNFRRLYGMKNPTDVNMAAGEDEIAERAHNEYLQILSELGIIGGAIFLSFLAGIVYLTFRLWQNRKRASLFPFAALTGVYLFLASSFVSSYSFRLIQNGLVFFFALALASKLIARRKQDRVQEKTSPFVKLYLLKSIYAAGIILSLSLGANSIFRAVSASYSNQLLGLQDTEKAKFLYDQATFYNRENPSTYLGYGLYLINQQDYREAAVQLRKAINYGEASSGTYSLLATAQNLGGDAPSAVETFAEAVEIYPRSTFVRTRYADLLQQTGNETEAQNQLNIAYQINLKHAKSWWSLYQEGVAKTNLKTVNDKNMVIVFDLKPQISYTAYMLERWIRYPKEKPNYDLLTNIR